MQLANAAERRLRLTVGAQPVAERATHEHLDAILGLARSCRPPAYGTVVGCRGLRRELQKNRTSYRSRTEGRICPRRGAGSLDTSRATGYRQRAVARVPLPI